MRMVANCASCDVLFTLFRLLSLTDGDSTADAKMVERDLGTQKKVIDGSGDGGVLHGINSGAGCLLYAARSPVISVR